MSLQREFRSQGDFLFKYRSYLPIIIIIIGLVVYLESLLSYPEHNSNQISSVHFICLSISLFGVFIRFFTIGYSADNTSGRNTSEGQIASSVNSTGIYSVVRHPLYLGNFFMWVGIACLSVNVWFIVAFTLFYWLYYERIMYAEEMFLIDKYGTDYTDWSSITPAFIPRFQNWKSPKLSFSWIKIIRQEKAGILNLCIVYFLFNIFGQLYMHGAIELNNNYWFYLMIFGLSWYVFIKLIQKTTSLLLLDRN